MVPIPRLLQHEDVMGLGVLQVSCGHHHTVGLLEVSESPVFGFGSNQVRIPGKTLRKRKLTFFIKVWCSWSTS
jgi:hypothetical protein